MLSILMSQTTRQIDTDYLSINSRIKSIAKQRNDCYALPTTTYRLI